MWFWMQTEPLRSINHMSYIYYFLGLKLEGFPPDVSEQVLQSSLPLFSHSLQSSNIDNTPFFCFLISNTIKLSSFWELSKTVPLSKFLVLLIQWYRFSRHFSKALNLSPLKLFFGAKEGILLFRLAQYLWKDGSYLKGGQSLGSAFLSCPYICNSKRLLPIRSRISCWVTSKTLKIKDFYLHY